MDEERNNHSLLLIILVAILAAGVYVHTANTPFAHHVLRKVMTLHGAPPAPAAPAASPAR